MSHRLRIILAATVGLALAVMGATDIAGESYGLAALVAAASLWIVVEWRSGASPEAWILSAALFGYIVGNRGFAQFQFAARVPLLPAETALLFCTMGLLFRSALSKAMVMRVDAVNVALIAWMLYGTARLPFGMREYGVVALRDYALVYYAVFFFVSQYLCRDPKSSLMLDRAMTAALLVLPIGVVIDKAAPDFFAHYLSWNGLPLIYYKSDLIAASLVSGSFWFWSRFESSRRRAWLLPSAVSLLLVGAEDSPRAALVGGIVATAAWLYARRFRLVQFQAAVIAAGIAVSIPVEMLAGRTLVETKSYEMYERVVSIVDLGGTHSYQNLNSASTTDNNQFRRVWWWAVYDETVTTSPLFGLGFGYDLAARFLADYNWLSAEEEFTTRSPHSVILTNFGRLGAIGAGLFLLTGAMVARSAFRSFRARDIDSMAWWSVVMTVGVSACFGVVLESPMGAVVFWTSLGMAHCKTCELKAPGPDAAHRPVANPAAIGSESASR